MNYSYFIKFTWGEYYIVCKSNDSLPHLALPYITILYEHEGAWRNIYRSNKLFSRLLSAYICIDFVPKWDNDWTVEQILRAGGFEDVMQRLGIPESFQENT